ncbi:MAG: 16S rRNA (guanine(966)-N(2))-methyltransferase RsmD [Desulfonatronovibrio sp.]
MRLISGEYKGRILKTGKGPGYRPATGKVRESLFSMLESRVPEWPEMTVLDVFAGSGSLGLETLSRGAGSALFIEKSFQACAIIKENISILGISPKRARVKKTDALSFLSRPGEIPFDLVFIDPPYGMDMVVPAINMLMDSNLLNEKGLISAEVEAFLAIDTQFHPDLKLVKDRLFGQTRILIWSRK